VEADSADQVYGVHPVRSQAAAGGQLREALRMKVRVLNSAGEEKILKAEPGMRLMEVIRNSGMPIRAECGGACACATCHVYVDAEWFRRLPPPDENETALIEFAEGVGELSRLSCQIRLTEQLDDIKVMLAPGSE
jgi:ferredoxin, 2Fe-2S